MLCMSITPSRRPRAMIFLEMGFDTFYSSTLTKLEFYACSREAISIVQH